MTNCFGISLSFDLLCVSFVNFCHFFLCLCASFGAGYGVLLYLFLLLPVVLLFLLNNEIFSCT